MPAARHVELFFARVFDLHRPARGQRQRAANIFQQHLLLAAESAADARLDHVHAAHRDLQDHRHLAAGVIRHLGAAADHQAVVGVQPTDGDVRLQRAMLLPLGAEFTLDDKVGIAETVFHVADLSQNISGNVVRGVVDPFGIRLVMDHRRAGAMACSISSTAGSTSYSTSIRRSASSAMARLSAATAATRSPTNRTLESSR